MGNLAKTIHLAFRSLLLAAVVLAIAPPAIGQSEPNKNGLEDHKSISFSVVDDNLQPVEGIRVRLSRYYQGNSLRMRVDPNIPKAEPTDSNGKCTVYFPNNEKIDRIIVLASDHRFLVKHAVLEVGKEDQVVKLTKGKRVEISVVDNEDNPLEGLATVMASGGNAAWSKLQDGHIWTNGLGRTRSQLMVVQPDKLGKTKFGNVLIADGNNRKPGEFADLVTEGTELCAKLSDAVPRPVKRGFAIVCVAPLPAENNWSSSKFPSLVWTETVSIKEDGTFRFAVDSTAGHRADHCPV